MTQRLARSPMLMTSRGLTFMATVAGWVVPR
jgi:hypothetical protein